MDIATAERQLRDARIEAKLNEPGNQTAIRKHGRCPHHVGHLCLWSMALGVVFGTWIVMLATMVIAAFNHH